MQKFFGKQEWTFQNNIKFHFFKSSSKIINAQINIQPVKFLLQCIKNFFASTNALLFSLLHIRKKCKQNNKSCATEEFLEILKNWK
jgi:hypothetical protein